MVYKNAKGEWVDDGLNDYTNYDPTKQSQSSTGGVFSWLGAISQLGNTYANIVGASNGNNVNYTAQQQPAPTAAQAAQQAQQPIVINTPAAETKKSNTATIVLVVVAILVLITIMFFVLKKK